VVLARSGRKVVLELPAAPGRAAKAAVLRAFGRVWTQPADVAGSERGALKIEVNVPAVRVATVFSVTAADDASVLLGELVAYPDRNVTWDRKTVVYACAAPGWFSQWASATGLPVTVLNQGDEPADKPHVGSEDAKAVMVIGRAAAGKELSDALKLSQDKKLNVLVLDADWFGQASGPAAVRPGQTHAGLSGLAGQTWPQPLTFAAHRAPYGGIVNRWAWIMDDKGLPLVEEVRQVEPLPERADARQARLVLSYVPWQEQLGRREIADAVFLDLLKACAADTPAPAWKTADILYPPLKEIDPKARPVLASAARVRWGDLADIPSRVYIVDLRGSQAVPQGLLRQLQLMEQRAQVSLLILGDDPLLDECKWLKLDRRKKAADQRGVVWAFDDELGPSTENQIRLMLKLTELGVPLAPPSQQEKQT
jgi:hypothetical protein